MLEDQNNLNGQNDSNSLNKKNKNITKAQVFEAIKASGGIYENIAKLLKCTKNEAESYLQSTPGAIDELEKVKKNLYEDLMGFQKTSLLHKTLNKHIDPEQKLKSAEKLTRILEKENREKKEKEIPERTKSPRARKKICYDLKKVLELVSLGCSINQISKMPGMPGNTYLYNKLAKDAEFAEKYARAREIRADRMFEEMIQIADESSEDFHETNDGIKLNREAIERSRIRIDTRKWVLAKMMPKKYGEKIEADIKSGGEPIRPVICFTRRQEKDNAEQ